MGRPKMIKKWDKFTKKGLIYFKVGRQIHILEELAWII